MNNFEMGFLDKALNKNEDEQNLNPQNSFEGEDSSSFEKEELDTFSSEEVNLLLKNILNIKTEDINKKIEYLQEFKAKEEEKLSKVETKSPFAKKIKRILLIITTTLVLMNTLPLSAASLNNEQYESQRTEVSSIENDLEINEETKMIRYTYNVDNSIDFNDYKKDRTLTSTATAELSFKLQKIFNLDKVKLSGVNYDYQPGKIIMELPFINFYHLNLAEDLEQEPSVKNQETENNLEKSEESISLEKNETESNENIIPEKPNFTVIEDPFSLEKDSFKLINFEGVDYFAFLKSVEFNPNRQNIEKTNIKNSATSFLKNFFSIDSSSINLRGAQTLLKSNGEDSKVLALIPMEQFVNDNLENNSTSDNKYAEAFKKWYL